VADATNAPPFTTTRRTVYLLSCSLSILFYCFTFFFVHTFSLHVPAKLQSPKDRGKLLDTQGAVNEKKYIRNKGFPFSFQDHPDVLNSSMKNDFFSKLLFVPGSEDDCNGEKHETDAE
jgi:hypothetical protein